MRYDYLKKTKGFISYKRKCTNGGDNAGSHCVKIEPAANSVVLIYFVSSRNMDATAVSNNCYIMTAGGVALSGSGNIWSAGTLAAGGNINFPRSATGTGYLDVVSGPSFILTNAYEILIMTGSVAVSEDTDFCIMYQYIGDAPTITETGPAGCTWSDIA